MDGPLKLGLLPFSACFLGLNLNATPIEFFFILNGDISFGLFFLTFQKFCRNQHFFIERNIFTPWGLKKMRDYRKNSPGYFKVFLRRRSIVFFIGLLAIYLLFSTVTRRTIFKVSLNIIILHFKIKIIIYVVKIFLTVKWGGYLYIYIYKVISVCLC